MMDVISYTRANNVGAGVASGIESYGIDGLTLIMVTYTGQVLKMYFPKPKDGRGIKSLNIDSSNHLIVTYTDDATEDIGPLPTAVGPKGDKGDPGSIVEIEPIQMSGTKIATITIDGVPTDLYAPEGGGGDTGLEILSVGNGIDYDPDTKKLKGVQYPTMPTPASIFINKVIQYVGADVEQYKWGKFYKCVQKNNDYYWEPTNDNNQPLTKAEVDALLALLN